jgi:hypothetical protein
MLKILCLAILSFLIFSAQGQEAKIVSAGNERNPGEFQVPLKSCGGIDSLFGDDFLSKKIIIKNVGEESVAAEWKAICVDRVINGKNEMNFSAPKYRIKPQALDTLEVFFKKCCGECFIFLTVSDSRGDWDLKITTDQYTVRGKVTGFFKK